MPREALLLVGDIISEVNDLFDALINARNKFSYYKFLFLY